MRLGPWYEELAKWSESRKQPLQNIGELIYFLKEAKAQIQPFGSETHTYILFNLLGMPYIFIIFGRHAPLKMM